MRETHPEDVVIIGCGGSSRELLDLLLAINAASKPSWNIRGFVDDNAALHGTKLLGLPVLGALSLLKESKFHATRLALGVASDRRLFARRDIRERLGIADHAFPVLIHPTANVSKFARLGAGTIIFGGVQCSPDVSIGKHVLVLPNSVLAHDNNIGSFATICACVTLGGNVAVGEGAYLGMGATVTPKIRIGTGSLIGAGAVVLKDVPEGMTVFGNPARTLPKHG